MRIADTCCGSLKTGVFNIGIVGILAGIHLIYLADDGDVSYENGLTNKTNKEEKKETQPTTNSSFVAIYLTLGIIQFIINIALLYGVAKRKPMFMLPWLIVNTLYLIASLVLIVVLASLIIMADPKEVTHHVYFFLAGGVLTQLLFIWMWLCVLSLYREFKEQNYSRLEIQVHEIEFIDPDQNTTQPNQPTEPTQSTVPTGLTQPTEPTQLIELTQPTEPTQPTQLIKPTQPENV